MDNKDLQAQLQEKRAQNRIILIKAITCLFAFAVIGALVYTLAGLTENSFFSKEVEEHGTQHYEFDPRVDYEYDIMEDSGYKRLLEAAPLISLCDSATGVTTSLMPEEYDTSGEAVKLLTTLVKAIQWGNVYTYNSCFSDAYIAASGTEDGFTMQQIYEVVITRVAEETSESGVTTANYRLKYKIRRNNGTLRLDMGSDSYREQTIIMTDNNAEGKLKIDSVSINGSLVIRTVYSPVNITVTVIVSVLVLAAVATVTVYIFRKLGKKTKEKPEDEETAGS